MPMFDFVCAACGAKFEDLVRGGGPSVCPKCGAGGAERQLSAPSPPGKRAFPFKPGPARPMPGACGMRGCGAGCGESCGEGQCPTA
ncbi:MAG: zinc ribbon domain-containing protein [Desulfovibrio sp.]|jgi:putative FmdB family regulatory protein|nr:zinc ribbon domain-containing protein [Desulfovibrio sp.]